MGKKKLISIVAVGGVAIIATIMYVFLTTNPGEFPSEDQLLAEMERVYPGADVEEIQDILFLNDTNVFVPFISTKDKYGLSVWVWDKNRWDIYFMSTSGVPSFWMLDEEDPGSSRIIWNLHPDDSIEEFSVYLYKERHYQVSNGVKHYTPKVMMENKIITNEQMYGVTKFPRDWSLTMNAFQVKAPDTLLTSILSPPYPNHFQYYWLPLSETVTTDLHLNLKSAGGGWSRGGGNIGYFQLTNEEQLDVLRNK